MAGRNPEALILRASWRENQQRDWILNSSKHHWHWQASLKPSAAKLSSGHQVDQTLLYSSSPSPYPGMHIWNLDHAVATHRFKQWALWFIGSGTELQTWWRWAWWNREGRGCTQTTRDLLKHLEIVSRVPWHRLRYENLKKLRPKTSWSLSRTYQFFKI